MGIGSGGNFALAAARALLDSDLDAEAIARKAMAIAADICVYTNNEVVIESLESRLMMKRNERRRPYPLPTGRGARSLLRAGEGVARISIRIAPSPQPSPQGRGGAVPRQHDLIFPREIVSELDRHIVGQRDAKRAVAIALRNRWRRQQLDDELREEVLPKNILMIGPTGVGKTEISRRLAKLAGAPFIKVEATKFTEVGYVGRDVDQIIRDLLEAGIGLVRDAKRKEVEAKAQLNAEERVIDALVGANATLSTRDAFRKRLRAGELDDREIEIQVADTGARHARLRDPRHAWKPCRHDQSLRRARQGASAIAPSRAASPCATASISCWRKSRTS